MGGETSKRAKAEKKLRQEVARKRQGVIAEIRRTLDRFTCPTCRSKLKITEHLRTPRHDLHGSRCLGSNLAIGWFPDGLAAIPYDRYDDAESIDARRRLRRNLTTPSNSERRSTSVIGDRPAPRKTVSGGLPGLKR